MFQPKFVVRKIPPLPAYAESAPFLRKRGYTSFEFRTTLDNLHRIHFLEPSWQMAAAATAFGAVVF